MNKIIVALLLLVCSGVYAQDSTATQIATVTTDEEYNYLTRGYKVQVESGLDMKKGYHFQDAQEIELNTYKFQFKFLMRTAAPGGIDEMAAILAVVTSTSWGNVYYVCIPIGNTTLATKYRAFIAQWDKPLLLEYGYVTSMMFGQFATTLNDEMLKK